jgi:hypothetical protein
VGDSTRDGRAANDALGLRVRPRVNEPAAPDKIATASETFVTALATMVYSLPVFMARETAQVDMEQAPSQSASPASKSANLIRGAEIALLAAAIAGFVDTLRFAAYFIPLHFSVNFEEGNILNAALRITHGLTPYPPVGGLPYVVNPYGPVFYYAVAPLVKLFGVSFAAPRFLVLASGLAVALFLVLLLRRWTESWWIALGFGLSFLAVSLVRDWIYVLRVDLFGLALSLAGVYVFSTSRRLAWPALLFVAALFAKITLIAAPIACFLYLMMAGERSDSGDTNRRAWRFAGWMTGFGLAGLAALGFATGGWGLFHMFLTHPDPYLFSQYVSIIRPFALLDGALLVAVAFLALHDIRRHSFSLPLIYFALASVMTLTAGKLGSDANHLLEWQAAMCLAAGCGYHALRKRPKSDPVLALIPLGIIVLISLGLPESRQVNPVLSGCEAAYHFAAQQPGELLTENPGAAVLSGKTVWLSNSFEYGFLGNSGHLDQEPLIRLVQRRYFGVILLGYTLPELKRREADPRNLWKIWPPQFVSALAQNYHPAAQFTCADANVAYEPNFAASFAPTATH